MTEEKKVATPNDDAPSANVDELTQKIAALEEEKTNLVGELKEDRTKRQDLKTEIEDMKGLLEEATKKASEGTGQSTDIKSVVEEVLASKDASSAKSNKKAALEKFISEHKEFHEDNDVTGLRREALEKELNNFNLSGIVSEKDFTERIRKANTLLGGNTPSKTSGETVVSPQSSTPTGATASSIVDNTGLDEREVKLIKQNGWTKERYEKLRDKNPDYVANLLNYVR